MRVKLISITLPILLLITLLIFVKFENNSIQLLKDLISIVCIAILCYQFYIMKIIHKVTEWVNKLKLTLINNIIKIAESSYTNSNYLDNKLRLYIDAALEVTKVHKNLYKEVSKLNIKDFSTLDELLDKFRRI